MPNRLKDKVAIVTGGGTGIGKAIARIFAAEGAKVAVCGRTPEPLEETVAEIARAGGKAAALTCDVSDARQVRAMVAQTLTTFGQLNVLINNAGVRASIGTIEDL